MFSSALLLDVILTIYIYIYIYIKYIYINTKILEELKFKNFKTVFSMHSITKLKWSESIYSPEKGHMLDVHCYFEFLNEISS